MFSVIASPVPQDSLAERRSADRRRLEDARPDTVAWRGTSDCVALVYRPSAVKSDKDDERGTLAIPLFNH